MSMVKQLSVTPELRSLRLPRLNEILKSITNNLSELGALVRPIMNKKKIFCFELAPNASNRKV